MALVRYKFSYDSEVDSDIENWINSFPKNKKSEMIRHAIRYYMSQTNDNTAIQFPTSQVIIKEPPVNGKSSVVETTEKKKPQIKARKIPAIDLEEVKGGR